jgi:hypothetical protein
MLNNLNLCGILQSSQGGWDLASAVVGRHRDELYNKPHMAFPYHDDWVGDKLPLIWIRTIDR